MTQSCHFFGELIEGDGSGDLANFAKLHQVVVAFGAHARLPRLDDALGEGSGAVGQGQIVINGDDAAEAAAGGAGADGMIEAEQGGGGFAVFDVAMSAMQAVGEKLGWQNRLAGVAEGADGEPALAEMIGLFARLYKPGAIRGRRFEPVLNHRERRAGGTGSVDFLEAQDAVGGENSLITLLGDEGQRFLE